MTPKNGVAAKADAISLIEEKRRDTHKMGYVTAMEIEEVDARRSALGIEQARLQRKKLSLDTASNRSIDAYARAWNHEFVAKIQEFLTARELRDMVYVYLIGGRSDATILPSHERLYQNRPNDYYFHLEPCNRRGRSRGRGRDDRLAHYFQEKFMGEEFAIEIAQVFHRHVCYKVRNINDVPTLLRDGPLTIHPACRPQNYLRMLTVYVSIDPYRFDSAEIFRARGKESYTKKEDYEKQLIWLTHLQDADQVSQMDIRLNVQARNASTIRKYKAILLPHIQELVKKGCKVAASYKDVGAYYNVQEKITYDSTMLLPADGLENLVAEAFDNEK